MAKVSFVKVCGISLESPQEKVVLLQQVGFTKDRFRLKMNKYGEDSVVFCNNLTEILLLGTLMSAILSPASFSSLPLLACVSWSPTLGAIFPSELQSHQSERPDAPDASRRGLPRCIPLDGPPHWRAKHSSQSPRLGCITRTDMGFEETARALSFDRKSIQFSL